MNNDIVTPGRLTIKMPVVPMKDVVVWPDAVDEINSWANTVARTEALAKLSQLTHERGRQLVHDILVRKGNNYIMNKNGTRLKPVAQIIFAKGMQRLASNESPETIVRDLEIQLQLLKGPH